MLCDVKIKIYIIPNFLKMLIEGLGNIRKITSKKTQTTLKASWGREELCLIYMKFTDVSLLWLKAYFKLKISPLTDFRVHGIYFALVVIEEVDWKVKLILWRKVITDINLGLKWQANIILTIYVPCAAIVSFNVWSVVTLLKCNLRDKLLAF